MAPKTKSRLVDQPPSASSSEEQEEVEESQEEEEQHSGEETEEDEEPTIAPPVVKRPITQKPVQTSQKPQFSSESGSENGSGSELEAKSGHSPPSPSVSDFTIKPIVSAKASSPSKPAGKRPQEAQQEKGRKKPKTAEEEDKKSAATPRSLWNDDDQLALLKGVVEYKTVKGMEPNADMSAFHEFIRGKLLVEVSKSQLSEKLKRLKKKFLTNAKGGEEPVFMKGQDFLEIVTNSTNGKAKKTVEAKKSSEPKRSAKVSKPKDDEKHKEEENQDFQSEYPRLAASFESMSGMFTMYPNGTSFLKEKMSLIAPDKAKLLEEKWKKLEDDEAALMVKRLDLIAEHYGLVVDAMRVEASLGTAEVECLEMFWFILCNKSFPIPDGNIFKCDHSQFLQLVLIHFVLNCCSCQLIIPVDLGRGWDIALLRKRTLQKDIEDLPPREKQILLQYLRRKNVPIHVSESDDASSTWFSKYEELFSQLSSVPRRKKPLLPKKRAPVPPLAPSPIPATVQSPASSPSPGPKAVLTLAPSPGASTVSLVYAPAPSIEVPTSSPLAVQPPSPYISVIFMICIVRFNEEMMDSLFGYIPGDQGKDDRRKASSFFDQTSQCIQIIDHKKSQNLAILLKASNVTTEEEVYDALGEGNELPRELIRTLLKMAPPMDEELKLR
ncbi:hypothetical protein H5410_038141 [Solanum commersonii]|uniref:Uncharacterized protein n=1 Tax=Solanum commersonii TaxID=4109 RepID=A0A9J5Y9X3_SOLCO|nr:hypothetical protein H5410_038141 [Solanum commersonii]